MYTSTCINAIVSLLPSSMVAAKTAIASRRRSNLCCQVLNLRPLLLSAKQNSKKKLFSKKTIFRPLVDVSALDGRSREMSTCKTLKKLKQKNKISLFLLLKKTKKNFKNCYDDSTSFLSCGLFDIVLSEQNSLGAPMLTRLNLNGHQSHLKSLNTP